MKLYRVWNCTLNTEVMRGTLKECQQQLKWYKGAWSLRIEEVTCGHLTADVIEGKRMIAELEAWKQSAQVIE